MVEVFSGVWQGWNSLSLYSMYIWLIVSIIFLIFELSTPGLFFFISLSAGAVVSAVVGGLGFSVPFQCEAFLIGSVFSLVVMRYFFSGKRLIKIKTNIDALLHKQAVVTESIGPDFPGRVKVRGEYWPAVTTEKRLLHKGTLVEVVGIEGNKLVVK
jgi:membrane protein implicated in regulation of membrane protease activity